MKIFLSAVEGSYSDKILQVMPKDAWNLISFYYAKKNLKKVAEIKNRSELMLVDSGAHSFQKGAKVEWDSYTDEYCQFIKDFDEEKVLGYFEMDVDNIIGYDKVLELRRKMLKVTDKVIPVWHKNRGVAEFTKMCQEFSGKIVAITGFRNEDIRDDQYLMFVKEAWKYGCKIHCLGLTRAEVLNKVPFDFTDSSSWLQEVVYGQGRRSDGTKFKIPRTVPHGEAMAENYKSWCKIQKMYYNKWRLRGYK